MTNNYEGDPIDAKDVIPLLPIRDIVVYPFMILPLFVGRESSISAVEDALEHHDRLIVLASQKDISAETPTADEIYNVGTLAMIMRVRKLPDGRIKILIQGLSKVKIGEFKQSEPHFKVRMEKIENPAVKSSVDVAVLALIRNAKEQLEKIISHGKILSPDILMILEDIEDPGRLADLIASNLNLKVSEAQEILETIDPVERLHRINQILSREFEVIVIQNKIRSENSDRSSKNQKENFIKEQIKALKCELGADDGSGNGNGNGNDKQDEFTEFREKITSSHMPTDVEKEAIKQLSRLEKMHPESSESSILRNYLECILDLPWSKSSDENLDLENTKRILDEDHYDLEKVKDRIIEYLAVRRLKGKNMKGPILCFMGPPGVGKTSLGKSIARAMGRKFVRISLGGIRDEAEIRGHRRTYVGAMPGRFVQALHQAQTNNPIIMLDEVDKLGQDFRGDPASALLEVLDPEQNHTFRDHYLNVPFDLSNTMFIATANSLENIPHPLRDRMEILSLSGYIEEEKLSISNKFLIPKQMEENGINADNIEFSAESIIHIIRNFTAEAGLRALERKIGSICRKVARKVVMNDKSKNFIDNNCIEDMLGPPLFHKDIDHDIPEVGVAQGLAWTQAGGELIYIETDKMRGTGLTLTGQLGEIMKESAKTAVGHIRAKSRKLGIADDFFEKHELHIHIPSGAIPKDGPSAGVTLATALVSLITNTPIHKHIAMTGEITLTGKVLPVGGIKEKALAAIRDGITTIIIPWENKKDLVEIPKEYKDKLKFICVKKIDEVLNLALVDWKEKESERQTAHLIPDVNSSKKKHNHKNRKHEKPTNTNIPDVPDIPMAA
ncbi:MAG: endopeptidase La [Oligoflexia bacterium]|nr:endopeptidase La [Oligoflexia bacterium]